MNGYPSCMNRNRNSMMRTNAAPSGCSSIPSRQGMAPTSMPHQDASCIQSPAGQPETRSETSMLPSSRGALLWPVKSHHARKRRLESAVLAVVSAAMAMGRRKLLNVVL